jgi:LuxR family transcriptional regulator, quorum-sensing system regulator BjaR1
LQRAARCSSAILLEAALLAFHPFKRVVALTRRSLAKRRLLTPREREVLAWVARGKSAWEIGEILDIAKRTVDEHVQSAVRKLRAVNRTHAVALAIRDHVVEI